jgi:hypothetical protein
MRKAKFWMTIVGALSLVLWGCFQNLALDMKTPRMTKEELKSMLDHPDVIIIDVRLDGAWNKSRWKIKGAVREDPEKVNAWAYKYPKDKTLVFY